MLPASFVFYAMSIGSNILKATVPMLLIVYAAHPSRVDYLTWRRELFGGTHYYLDLNVERKPRFADGAGLRIPFSGFLASDTQEEKVSGFAVRNGEGWTYEFAADGGKFIGKLKRGSRSCEPELHFTFLDSKGSIKDRGVLKAGFCG